MLGVTGSDGTFEIDMAATALPLKCGVLFRSIYDEKKIEFKCADVPSYISVQVSQLFDLKLPILIVIIFVSSI